MEERVKYESEKYRMVVGIGYLGDEACVVSVGGDWNDDLLLKELEEMFKATKIPYQSEAHYVFMFIFDIKYVFEVENIVATFCEKYEFTQEHESLP